MGYFMTDVLTIVVLVLFFWGAKITKPFDSFDLGEYMSVDSGKKYRGFFAVAVVLHHLAQRTETGITFNYFGAVGYLSVAFFFFLSGYGLQKSYITKSDSYKKGFLLKRIPSILIPYVIMAAFYWLAYLFMGNFFSPIKIIATLVSEKSIVSNSWYIVSILIFYVTYWLLMMICKKRYSLMILLGCFWYILYAFFCVKVGHGSYWYNASQLLVVGMFWATYERKILEFIKKRYFVIAPMIWALFIILAVFREQIAGLMNVRNVSTILIIITAVLFVLSVVMFKLKVRIGNKSLEFLGGISIEIYLSQGIFMDVLRPMFVNLENEFLWCVIVLSGTIIISYLLHIVIQYVLKKYKLLLEWLRI